MQITSDRDRVPRARCSRRKKEGGEDGSGEECSGDERCCGRRRDELNGGKEGGKGRSESDDDVQKRDRARACTHVRMYVHAEGDSPHCDCYTHGRNVPPVCRLMPTRNQTRARTHPTVRSRPSNGATGCTTFHLPSGLPPAIHAIHIHTSRTRPRTLFVRTVNRGREREIERKRKEREEKVSLTTGSTVYEKCSTRTYRERKKKGNARDSL